MTDPVEPPLTGDALKAKTYAEEAAARRIENRTLKETIAARDLRIAELEKAPPAALPPPVEDPEEVAAWNELGQVLDASGKARQLSVFKTVLAGLGAISPDDAADLLQARGLVAFDADGAPLVRIGEAMLPLDAKSVARVLGPHQFKSSGVSGAGSPRTTELVPDSGLDMEKAAIDAVYYREHRAEVIEALRNRQAVKTDGQ